MSSGNGNVGIDGRASGAGKIVISANLHFVSCVLRLASTLIVSSHRRAKVAEAVEQWRGKQ